MEILGLIEFVRFTEILQNICMNLKSFYFYWHAPRGKYDFRGLAPRAAFALAGACLNNEAEAPLVISL